jgi:hypothetical protein
MLRTARHHRIGSSQSGYGALGAGSSGWPHNGLTMQWLPSQSARIARASRSAQAEVAEDEQDDDDGTDEPDDSVHGSAPLLGSSGLKQGQPAQLMLASRFQCNPAGADPLCAGEHCNATGMWQPQGQFDVVCLCVSRLGCRRRSCSPQCRRAVMPGSKR